MATQLRVQTYLDRHKITPLFEDLMNKVVHDMPDEPVLYIIKLLYKKAGKPIPDDLRFTAMRKSLNEMNRGRSPDASRRPRPAQTTSLHNSSEKSPTRTYGKPLVGDGRLAKKISPHDQENSTKAKPRRNPNNSTNIRQTSLEEFLIITPIKPDVRKPRADWNTDVKNVTLSEPKPLRQSSPEKQQSRSAWASIGLDSEENLYRSGTYRGPQVDDLDPLENELQIVPTLDSRKFDSQPKTRNFSHRGVQKMNAERHKRELRAIVVTDNEKSSAWDSGIDNDHTHTHDDAIELLEDAQDLLDEGVANIPASGYKLSKIMRERKSESDIKLNINLYPRSQPGKSRHIEGTRYGELPSYDDESDRDDQMDTRPSTGHKSYIGESDEDFESVSQVTGPRHPVWNDAQPDAVRHSYPLSMPQRHPTVDAPLRSLSPEEPRLWDNKLSMSSPSPHKSLDYGAMSLDKQEELGVYHGGNRGWTPKGEGSEVSIKRSRDPRMY